ncbi:MAG: glutamate racemase [Patescibacteria group bacterium]
MIGIFDSGLGGLTVLQKIKKKLPQYDYLYLGDTLHVPYGNRSDEAIYELTSKACVFLFNQGCELIVIACNTATAKALRRLQKEFLPNLKNRGHKNILGVVRPLAEYVGQKVLKKVGVIGTIGTINSHAYQKEIFALNENLKVIESSAPLLVPLIEEGWVNQAETLMILKKYLRIFQKEKVETLILGCTHYPMLLQKFKKILKNKINVPDPGKIIADSLQDYLLRHPEIEKNLKINGRIRYCVTDKNENFAQTAKGFLHKKIKIEKVVL